MKTVVVVYYLCLTKSSFIVLILVCTLSSSVTAETNACSDHEKHEVFFLSVQLLNHHVVTELLLIDVLMNNMMERISDPCCTVRMLAVRGLGNIAMGSPEKVVHTHKDNLFGVCMFPCVWVCFIPHC